jgi:TRAP transporter TAXI family solute receptor
LYQRVGVPAGAASEAERLGYTAPHLRVVFRTIATFAMLVSICAACGPSPGQTSTPCLRIATGGADSVDYPFGVALARVFNEHAVGPCVAAVQTDGSTFNVNALDDASADFALARADTVYTAYVKGTPRRPRPHGVLRGVAIVYGIVLHLVVTDDSPVRAWTDLADARIGVWVQSAEVAPVVGYGDLVAAAGDLGPARIRGARMRLTEMAPALVSGEIAGGFILAAYPMESLRELARRDGIRLLEIVPDAATRIRARYPFFKPAIVPARVYAGQDEPVRTIALDNLLVTREDVDEESVYLLTRTLLESLPRLAQDHDATGQVNPDLASATPIPLHPGAMRYYRERELLR